MGTLIRENKRKIALSLNMGLLLMGCLMLTIGAYPALYSGGANETRLSIGATCIAFWFISFLGRYIIFLLIGKKDLTWEI